MAALGQDSQGMASAAPDQNFSSANSAPVPQSNQDGEDGDNKTTSRRLSSQTMNIFAEMRQKGQLTDVKIVVRGGQVFPAHRAILAGRSPFFRAIFTSDFRERKQDQIDLKETTSEVMSEILNYAYTKSVNLGTANVQDVIVAADKFLIQGLVDICSQFISHHLDTNNCMDVRRFAEWYNFFGLLEKSEQFMRSHFNEIWKNSEEFMDLPAHDLVSFLRDDQLYVRDEVEVWKAILKWINKDPTVRRAHLPTLILAVRLIMMDRAAYCEEIHIHPYVKECKVLEPLMLEAFYLQSNLELHRYPNAFPCVRYTKMTVPRIPRQVLVVLGGWSGGSPTAIIESYDIRADRWVKIEQQEGTTFGARSYHGAIVHANHVYVMGGFDGVEYYNSMRVYNIATRKWFDKAPMNCRRCYVSVALLNGKIYACGGYDGQHRTNTVEVYDGAGNQWSHVAPMHHQRSDAHAAVLHGTIYMVGGFNGTECMGSAECYDPATNSWTLLPLMLSRRSGVGVIGYKGVLYVIGGFSGNQRLKTGEKYNPKTRQWLPIAPMSSPRSNFAIEVFEDQIYVMGGFNGSQTISAVERYDPESNKWTAVINMSVHRSALYAIVLSDIPNLLDYVYRPRTNIFEEKRQELLRQPSRTLALEYPSSSSSFETVAAAHTENG